MSRNGSAKLGDAGLEGANEHSRLHTCKRHRLPPDIIQYANNRAELSHQPTRVRDRGMCRFETRAQAQRFHAVRSAVYNPFNLGQHLISPRHYWALKHNVFASWQRAVAA